MAKNDDQRWADQLRKAVREFIDREGISVTELSRRAKIPQQTLDLFVRSTNAPTLDKAQQIAKAIGFRFTS